MQEGTPAASVAVDKPMSSQSACGCGYVCATPAVPLKGLRPKDKPTLEKVPLKAAPCKSMVQQVRLKASVVVCEVLRCNY